MQDFKVQELEVKERKVKELMVKELEVQTQELEVKDKDIRNSCPVVISGGNVDFLMAGTSGAGALILSRSPLLPFSIQTLEIEEIRCVEYLLSPCPNLFMM